MYPNINKKKKNFPRDSRNNRATIFTTFSIIHMLTHGPSSGPRNSLISNSHSNTSHNTSISDAYNSLSYANAIFSPLHCQVSRFTPVKAARCPMTRIIEHALCETVGFVVMVCTYCCARCDTGLYLEVMTFTPWRIRARGRGCRGRLRSSPWFSVIG